MRRIAIVVALILAAALVTLQSDAQIRIRARPADPVGGGGGSTLTSSDFTYDGSYCLPDTTPGSRQTWGSGGLALRYESSDATNQVHLLSTSGSAIYEWRDITPQNPATPADVTDYTCATILKEYTGQFTGVQQVWESGAYRDWSGGCVGGCNTDGKTGLFVDRVGSESTVYRTYGDTYTYIDSETHVQPSLIRCTLNYSAQTASCTGPWYSSTQGRKALVRGMVAIPSSFATTYLGDSTKRLCWGLGGYGSAVAASDTSLGPSCTAISPPAGTFADAGGTPLVGYWPFANAPDATHDRLTRPAWVIPAADSNDNVNWGDTKSWWLDYWHGAAWIHGNSKSGLVFMGALSFGQGSYVSAHIAGEYGRHYMAIFSESDLATVAQGTNEYYEIQPTLYDFTGLGSIDYNNGPWSGTTVSGETVHNQYAFNRVVNITNITSSAANVKCGAACGSTGALVTTSSAHSFGVGSADQYISIRGTTRDSEFAKIWTVESVPSGTTLRIRDGNLAGNNWSGTTATGGVARGAYEGVETILGVAFDSTTCKFYVAHEKLQGANANEKKIMIARFSVNAGC